MRAPKRGQWLSPVLLLTGVAAVLFLGVYFLDYWLAHPAGGKSLLRQLTNYDPDTAQNALGNLAQVVAAVLGIAITVVSIVVQLAATRYTPRVTEMFFRDRTNLFVMGFFVVACIDAVWVSLAVSKEFMPDISITITLAIVTGSLLMLVPYFAYVFAFLDPEKVIDRIRQQALRSALKGRGETQALQAQVMISIEQLADISINALSNKDKIIATHSVDALKDLVVRYVPEKPHCRSEWFRLGSVIKQNPDFVAMAPVSLDDIESHRTWVEWKVLRQYQAIYTEAIGNLRDLAHQVAIDTRYIGEAALATRDNHVLELVAKFMNTFLRITLNARDVRTAYNVLNHYRLLCARLMRAGRNDLVQALAGHFKYYAQTAHTMDLGFVTETTAYDLAALCELAFELHSPVHDGLLRVLLEVDKPAETVAQERSLRGVRKAQAKLATFYLERGAEPYAREIQRDMAAERPERLRSIRDELLSVASKDFWEVIDRGTNFDYLEPGRREKLRVFFGWFPRLDEAGARLTASDG
ncbi:MAG TPA: DUF2254 family protein [Polyangia bacterium]|nr:DUF2254 family protein [Polyangia bacterium]